MATAKWIVTISSAHPITEVERELRSQGFVVEQVLEAVGSIIGLADPSLVDALRSLRGVEAVEPDLPFDVGPPDAPVS